MPLPVTTGLPAIKLDLPVAAYKDRIIECVLQNDVTILSSETGSGKSTQVPQYLLSAKHRFKRGRGTYGFRICVTQPRRVAAISLAKRVSEELGEAKTGGLVGYRVRFEESVSSSTAICYMTDGMLVRDAVQDKGKFSRYSVIVLDEVHERSLQTDILLGLVSEAVKNGDVSNRLKIVIMSATLNVESFASFFRSRNLSVGTVSVPGRTFPVSVWYTEEVEHDYVDASVCTILQIDSDYQKVDGDILVFLPGQDDIESVSSSLVARRKKLAESLLLSQKTGGASVVPNRELVIVHLYSALSSEKQQGAFDPVRSKIERKIILATNIAETSLTIPGVKFVVDCGLVKSKTVINSQVEVLRIMPASKATVVQRTGRAGREAAGGQCFRLYREADFEKLADSALPEIQRSELSSVLLQLTAMGIVGGSKPNSAAHLYQSLSNFPCIDMPSPQCVHRAEILLKRLGAVEQTSSGYALTEEGVSMAAFPVAPILSRLLVNSHEFGCATQALQLVAFLSVDNLWYNTKKSGGNTTGSTSHGDHWRLVTLFQQLEDAKDLADRHAISKQNGLHVNAFSKAVKIFHQIEKIYKSKLNQFPPHETRSSNPEPLLRLICKSMWVNCAKLVRKTNNIAQYETIDKIECYIHPSSALFRCDPPPQCVVFSEIIQTTKNYMQAVSPVESQWLLELVPMYFRSQEK